MQALLPLHYLGQLWSLANERVVKLVLAAMLPLLVMLQCSLRVIS